MPKISVLPAISAIAANDELPIIDTSAGTTKKVSIEQILGVIYPVGSIYTNASVSTNPATLLGFGTWTAFASGRVLVGVDSGQAEFDTLGETGGAKTHTLTTAEIPAHAHAQSTNNLLNNGATDAGVGAGWYRGASLGGSTQNAGGGGAHNNLQPYITVYMWKRTA